MSDLLSFGPGQPAHQILDPGVRMHAPSGGGAAAPSPLLTNLISYYSKEEASGTRNDAHGTNHLTDNNTVTQAAGKVGNAAKFTAPNSESLSIASNPSLAISDIDASWGFWVYLDTKSAQMGLVTKWNANSSQRGYQIYYSSAADRFAFLVSSDGTFNANFQINADALGSPATGTWYYINAWHDSVGNTINIQVNNGTVNSKAHTAGLFASTAAFALGAEAFSPFSRFLNGRLDEAGFWKRVLTTDERTWLWNGGSGRSYADVVAGVGL